ncbi:hypothetical protein BH10PSE17_BH10PSE17_15830 [soil metagenome]
MTIRHRQAGSRLRRIVLLTGAVLVLAFAASAMYDSWRLHEQLTASNDRELGNITMALAEGAGQNLAAVDLLLRDTVRWYEYTGRLMEPELRQNMFTARAGGADQVDLVSIVDEHGVQILRSRDTGEPMADVSDRAYFTRQRDDAATGLFINPPVVSRSERKPSLIVSRRLNHPDGSFMGVVAANVSLSRLERMYSALRFGEGSALVLALDDGSVVVRQPSVETVVPGQKMTELRDLKGGDLIDTVVSPVDGRVKSISVVGVGAFPMLLAITRDQQTALAPWRDEVLSGMIRTLVLALLVAMTMYYLLRQVERLDAGEQALRRSEQRYAMAMEAADEGHAEWNIPADLAFASARWRALHGVEPMTSTDDTIGAFGNATRLMRQVVLHPDDEASVRAAVSDHLKGRTGAVEIEYRVRQLDDQWHWIHARGRCLKDETEAGAPMRFFCAASDVTARKAAELQEAAMRARLQEAARLEALGTLSGGIAHDFNNILGSIIGFGEMAQQQAEPGSAMRRHLDRVMQAGARARLLVRRILDFSRSGIAEAGPVNIQSVVDEALEMLAPSLASGLRLTGGLCAGDAAVIADATQLHQIVMNLCTNAIQATGEHGEVIVRLHVVEVAEPLQMSHGSLSPGAHVRLEVVDRGPGIEPAVLERIFEPFFTTKRVGEGTGLGLSVVHGIVADLHGAIDVRSDAGGTRVAVWLPVEGIADREPVDDRRSESPLGHGETVMIVDDEPALVEFMEELLASLGYEPVGFSTAERALQAFEDDVQRFDAVLSDEMLPGMTGSELARRLHRRRADLPVILMTGRVSEALEREAAAAGIVAVLSKPLDSSAVAIELAARLRHA